MEHGEFILYQPDETVRLEVRVENETVWLNRQQLANLFGRDIKTIGKHINNALAEELDGSEATVAKFATAQIEGDRTITRQIEHYNLDMILSVGYRVKSKRGVEFRRWANPVLKDYMLKGYAINQRMEHLENKVDEKLATHERKLDELTNKVDFIISSSLPPVEGIFSFKLFQNFSQKNNIYFVESKYYRTFVTTELATLPVEQRTRASLLFYMPWNTEKEPCQ